MLDDVMQRLESLGFTTIESDSFTLSFIIEKVENLIKYDCNVDQIPDGLHHIAVDMVAGEFLFNKKSSGQLTDVDLEAVVKQVQEGDTSVTYAIGEGSSTPEQRFDALVHYLVNHGKTNFASFRTIKW